MSLRKLIIIASSFLFLFACADRTLFNGPGINPGLGGDFTEIRGKISGTLSKNDSPYFVSEDLIVDSLTSLSIEAGVQIFFKEKTQLKVHGIINAAGTRNEHIRFTAFVSPSEIDWEGIHIINPTGNSVFRFCVIERVYLPQSSSIDYGALEINNATVEIKNCIFQNNYSQLGGGLAILNSNVILKNNIFFRNDAAVYGGAILSENSTNKIINNTIVDNYSAFFGGGLVIVNPVDEDIQNNIFFDNFSFRGDPRIAIFSGDTTKVIEQYNYLAFGEMNPLFISNTDFHLQANSPCIDQGNPEPVYNDFDGTRNDQGAYGGPDGDW